MIQTFCAGIDNKVSARIAGGTGRTFYIGDHLGTTYGTANESGAFIAAPRPDSFGNGSTDFTGREYDSFTGLYYYRARMYDPKLGRFISEDPIGFDGGDINLFGYVNNTPTGRSDPYGLLDRGNFTRDLEMARQATQGVSPAAGLGGGALLVAGAKIGGVAIGGFAAGYAIGYYPGQWTANSPHNPFVYGPLNPFGSPYNPYAQPQLTKKPEPSCAPPKRSPWRWEPRFEFPMPSPLPRGPRTPPPGERERRDRCREKCLHLLPSPSGDLQSSEFHKCYSDCIAGRS